jgi:hypothetical protein
MSKQIARLRAASAFQFNERQLSRFKIISEALNASADPGFAKWLEGTFGTGASFNVLLGSNAIERASIAFQVAREAKSRAASGGLESALVTIRHGEWAFDPAGSTLDLTSLRKSSTQLKKLADSALGVIQFGCLPDVSGSYLMMAQVKAVVFGTNLRQHLPITASRLQKTWEVAPPFAQPLEIEWLGDCKHASKALVNLFDLADPLNRIASGELNTDKAAERLWKRSYRKRLLDRYRILTMCPLEKLIIATGELGPILDGAVAQSTGRVRAAYRAGDKQLSRDQIVHKWFDQVLRRGEHQVPPFIKLR